MDEPVCKRSKLTDTDSTYANTLLDEVSDSELFLPFINQFSYDIDKQDIAQNSFMEDSIRGIDQEPTPNSTKNEYAGHFNLTTMVSCHMTMTIQNQEKNFDTKYLGTGRFTGGEVSPIEWSVTGDPYPKAWGTLLNNVKVPVHIDTAVPRSYMTEEFYDMYPFLINHIKCKADIDELEIANGVTIPIKFMIPLVISFEGHMFEILMLVSGTKGDVLLVL